MVKASEKIDFNKVQKIDDLKKMNVSFEDAYKKLEDIIRLQEDNVLNLEDSIRCYKLGKILISYCQGILDGIRLEIESVEND